MSQYDTTQYSTYSACIHEAGHREWRIGWSMHWRVRTWFLPVLAEGKREPFANRPLVLPPVSRKPHMLFYTQTPSQTRKMGQLQWVSVLPYSVKIACECSGGLIRSKHFRLRTPALVKRKLLLLPFACMSHLTPRTWIEFPMVIIYLFVYLFIYDYSHGSILSKWQ